MQRPVLWFSITGVVLALLALLSRFLAARAGVDFQLHDTYFVLSPDRVFFVMAALCGMFAAAYAAFPMNPRAAAWHYWVTVIGIAGFWLSFYAWQYLIAQRSTSQSIAPRVETATALAFVLSFIVMLFSPAIFAVNFTFAIGRMSKTRMARKPH
jgi:heme/copper-type cytochrome/quinol oxidase subunit 1